MEKQKVKKKSKIRYLIIPIIILIVGIGIIIFIQLEIPSTGRNETLEQNICNIITATPSWVNPQGILIYVGYEEFETLTQKEVVDLLINAGIYFVYHSDCSACKSQIGYFGTEWERYVKSNYTIDCKYS